jgi:3-deoxy-D-manno-octulosonic-acid transferase
MRTSSDCTITVFCGQFMQNSKQICDELLSKGALQQVLDAAELIEKIIFFHQHPEKKKLQITRATQVLQANKGSVMNHLQLVEKLLNHPDSDVL